MSDVGPTAHDVTGDATARRRPIAPWIALAVAVVLGLMQLAVRYRAQMWRAIDAVVPGRLIEPRLYLAVHLALGLVLVIAIAVFAAIAEEVFAGEELAAFDRALAAALRSRTSPFWHSTFWWITWLGTGVVLGIVSAIVAFWLFIKGLRLYAMTWIASQAGWGVVSYSLKLAYARPRPEGFDPFLTSGGWSFPSGHAMGTLVFCGVAAYLLVRTLHSHLLRAMVITLALTWPLIMGFSRMYLGVHYATDVVAGFLAGAAWVAMCVSGTEIALRRQASASARR
jgi:undecaprenyl-diphosphatase